MVEMMRTLRMPKDEFIEKVAALAGYNERTFGACSQAIVAAFQEVLDLKDIQTLKAANAFSGGIARQGLLCGALLGGAMVLGMKYGRANMEDSSVANRLYGQIHKLFARFNEEFGSLNCRDIIGVNLLDPDESREFWASGRHDKECPEVVAKTARMVANILYEVENEFFLEKQAFINMSDMSKT